MRPRASKVTAQDVELAVANFFGIRTCVMVPNVSWGLFRDHNHEADMVMLRPSGWADEIEIKVSASDIKADLRKHRGAGHCRPELIRFLWFAVPEALATCEYIPAYAGILAMFETGKTIRVIRPAAINPGSRKLTNAEQFKLLRLGCMRVWTLKKHLQRTRLTKTKGI